MHELRSQEQMINMWLNHGQIKWNKLSMMRLLGFTDKHILTYSDPLQIWFPCFWSPLPICHKINDKTWRVSWLTWIDQRMSIGRMNFEKPSLKCFARWKLQLTIQWWIHQDLVEDEHSWRRHFKTWWKLRLLGWRGRRWSWRIPGCLRRCFLDLGWQWLLMVWKKISKVQNEVYVLQSLKSNGGKPLSGALMPQHLPDTSPDMKNGSLRIWRELECQ